VNKFKIVLHIENVISLKMGGVAVNCNLNNSENRSCKPCADHASSPHAKEEDAVKREFVEENSEKAQGHILIPELDDAAKHGAIC
jgi:hypothetical protein